MYNTENKKIGPVFFTGWNEIKIEKITARTAASGRKQLQFNCYGPPVEQEGFKPWFKEDKITPYEGQCGRISTSYFMPDNETEVGNLMRRTITPMLNAFGVKQAFDNEIKSNDTFEGLLEILNSLLIDSSLPFVWANLNGEEYEKVGKDRPGINLTFRNITNSVEYKESTPAGVLKKLTPPVATGDNAPY